MREQAEAEITKVLDRLCDHWTSNDATAYAAEFTEDSDYVAFDGTHLQGRTANEQHHARLFHGVLRGTRLENRVEKVRFVAADVAIAHTSGAVLFPWQTEHARRLSRQTMVLVKRDGRWMIEAFHNSRVRPMPREGSFGLTMATRFLRLRARLHRGG